MKIRRLWLDLGNLGELVASGAMSQWQDHGLGLLRTILHENGLFTDLGSVRRCTTWGQVGKLFSGYDQLLMNARSYTFPMACQAAEMFKTVNSSGTVLVGGMHATVDPDGMAAFPYFDHICQGAGEHTVIDLVKDPDAFPRVVVGKPSKSMAEWPRIDRKLWPRPAMPLATSDTWPLEPAVGWGPAPVATILTSRVCPWACSFCNEASYIPMMARRPPEMVVDELNELDFRYGPLGSVVIHDSMFFQNPEWLKTWLNVYPKKANRLWPYWAAGRADTVRQWPDLFESLIRETNWHTVSIGFESGSDNVLKTLNKECTVDDNYFCIDLLTRIGDDMEAKGQDPPCFWSNIMFGVPGETREDAFETVRMMRSTKRMMPSVAFYAPFPGSILGEQLIAEGRSLLGESHQRFPGDEKVRGVDYDFYRALLAGAFDNIVNAGIRWRP